VLPLVLSVKVTPISFSVSVVEAVPPAIVVVVAVEVMPFR
jgi:hypothetical protein